MTASPYSVAALPPVTPGLSADHSAATQAAPPPVTTAPSHPVAPHQAQQDTVALTSPPVAKSLNLSGRLLAQIDQETARVSAATQPAKDPQTTAATDPGRESAPKGSAPASHHSSNQQDRDNSVPQKQAANNGLIPMQVMQSKTKALAQAGMTLEEIALELHLDLKTVEEYVGSSSGSAAAAPVKS